MNTKTTRFPIIPEARMRLIANTLMAWSKSPRIRVPGKGDQRPTLGEIARRCSGAEGASLTAEQALEAHLDPNSGQSGFLDVVSQFGAALAREAYLRQRPHMSFSTQADDLGTLENLERRNVDRRRHLTFGDLLNGDLYAIGHKFALLGTELASAETQTVFSMLQANPVLDDGRRLFCGARNNEHTYMPGQTADLASARDALIGLGQGESVIDTLGRLAQGADYLPVRERAENRIIAISPSGEDQAFLANNAKNQKHPFRGDLEWYFFRSPEVRPAIHLAFEHHQSLPEICLSIEGDGIAARGILTFGIQVLDASAAVRVTPYREAMALAS